MTIGAAEFEFVRELVRRRTAIVLEPGKEYLVESRLAAVAREEGFASLEQLLGALRTQPANGLHRRVIEAMTTNETTFFRDVHPFEALRTTVLPELIERRAAQRQLTIWCAACSSGQEPYSVAMLLRDHFPQLASWTVRILATDLSTGMLERARAGLYTQLEVNRGLPATMLVRHFRKEGLDWRIGEHVRRMVEFRELNLAEPWPALPPMDIVLLRNVLIYFDVPTKKAILGRTRKLLRPDGWLFLGGAETTLNLDDGFTRALVGKTVAYRPSVAEGRS